VFAVGIVFSLVADMRVRAAYTASASVLSMPVPGTSEGGTTTTTKPLLSEDLPMLAQAGAVLDRVSRDLDGNISPNALMGHIHTDVYENSNVMRIRFLGRSRQEAIQGANAVADEVVNYYRGLATSRFDSLAADLKRQLAQRQQQLRDMDAELQRATAAYPYVEDGAGAVSGTSISALLVRLQTERDELSATLSGDAAQASITDERTIEAAPLARAEIANQDPYYKNVREQYGRDAAQLRLDQTQFSSKYPGLPELADIVGRERAALSGDEKRMALSRTQAYATALAEENRAHSLVANDRARLQQIDDTITALQNELTNPSSGVSVAALRRERQSAEGAYQLLSARLITTLADRAAAASTGSLIVLDYATYSETSAYSKPALITAAIMMVTLWIAITTAFALEALDRRFRSISTIETVYGSPVLGVV